VATEAQFVKQAKLLVVEDDVLIRTLLADMLCEIGYTVAAEAASIDEALEATRSRGPVRLAGCRRPRRPRHRVRLRHGL
jgi:CheY-like chemotaxis protein